MRDISVLTEADLRDLVPLDEAAVDEVERAFAALAGEGVVMPPILSMDLPAANGEVDVKTAYLPGFDGFAIKVSPGFFDNPKIGLPSLNGLMILFSAKTGLVEALLLDNGYLTDVRTAAAGAVAARHLAPEVTTAGVLGTGVQARLQIEAARLVRPFERVLVWGRDPVRAEICAQDIAESLGGIEVRVEADPSRVVGESQLVVTTTPAREPVLRAEWLHPGLHITAMGSDQPGKNEIDPAVFEHLSVYVPDRESQCRSQGELRAAIAAGAVPEDRTYAELGAVATEPALGRKTKEDITLVDLTGTGAQDTAIASFAVARAKDRSAGTVINA